MNWLTVLAVIVGLVIANVVYLAWFFGWVERQTAGSAYFSRPVAERRALKRQIRLLSLPTLPLMKLLSGSASRQGLPGFEFEGVWGPQKVATPEVFAKAKAYVPQPEDVFVATQMRCGTTWMQQIVHQVVTHGQGAFDPSSHRSHIYTISPWIDATHGVSMEGAPLVGAPPVRIVKTHLPAKLCPYSPLAKYIYVARHPVSCFASIVDFNRTMIGPLLPPVAALADWYCSDKMYWMPWVHHVDGYWRWAQRHDNVLFVHYEEMVRDFGAVLDRISAFLGHQLTPDERARVIEHTSFAFMKANEEAFEMSPPSMYSVAAGQFLASGREQRHEDVTPDLKRRILDYCRRELAQAEYPASTYYPDLT